MNKLYFIFIALLSFGKTFCQHKETKILLDDFLPQIEQKFDVRFSSASNNTKKIKIKIPNSNLNLESTLLYITQNTSLDFKKINDRYITIVPKNKKTVFLNPVTLTRYLTNGIQKKQDGSIDLNIQRFGILPGLTHVDVIQSIQEIPGIESENENTNYINVRGGTNDQNLILWEGIKMYHSSHFFGLISGYNVNFIDHVNVIKNGTSSKYNSGVSSTIELSGKSDISPRIHGGLGMDFISADIYLKIPFRKKMQLNLAVRKSIQDIQKSITYLNYFEKSFQDSDIKNTAKNNSNRFNSSFGFHDITGKFIYNLNKKNKLIFNYITIKNKLNYDENTELKTLYKSSNLSQQKTALGLNWMTMWNEKMKTKFKFSTTNYTINSFDKNIELDQNITQKNSVVENNFKIENEWKLTSKMNLNFGIELNETGVQNSTVVNNPFFKKNQKKVLITNSLYSEIKYQRKNTYFRTGFRLNRLYGLNKTLLEPRIVLKQQITPNLKFKVLGELKSQSVNQTVDFKDHFLGVENRRWVLSNQTNIPVVKSRQISYGMEFNKKNLVVELTLFYKKVMDITASSQGFYNTFQFTQNYGNYNTHGTEFLINKTHKKMSAWFSYTLSDNTYLFQNFDPKTFPNNVNIQHSSTLGLNYSILNNLKFSLGMKWKNGNVYTRPVFEEKTIKRNGITEVNFDKPNMESLPNFFRLDTSVKYNFKIFKKTKGTLSAGILNITNNNNIVQRYYKIVNNQVVEVNNQSLKITPNASFRLYF